MVSIYEIIDFCMTLNTIFIIGYLLMALILALSALLTNHKRLQKMSFKEQMMFFVYQPIIFIKEIRKIR